MIKKLMLSLIILSLSIPAYAQGNFAQQPQVKLYIKKMVRRYHFHEAVLTKIFSQVKIRPKVLQSMNAPLEKKPWFAYQRLFVTEWRIRQGVLFWNKHQAVLNEAEKRFGVPASIIVSTIGIETKYGERVGNFRVIDALSNLAFSHHHRASFFRKELTEFLLLSREQGLNPLRVMGSYAGAIGQPQFMPSSYRRFAINFSGDSKIDLQHDERDVIGSIANYYNKHGWQKDQPIAIPIKQSFYASQFIPRHPKANIIKLDTFHASEYWLSYPNFEVIKKYNSSDLYAMAVYQLSSYIKALKEKQRNV